MRKIGIYKGKEIDKEMITKIREIARLRYVAPVYNSSYWSIENIDDLAELHGISACNEILVLGEDWFLCYTVTKSTVEFLEWVALNNYDKRFDQALEMMRSMRSILIQNSDKRFKASMRHESSYPFYKNMLKRGYLKELSHSYDIDLCYGFAPERLKYLEENYSHFDNFLKSEEARKHPEYLTFIIHDIEFTVTASFKEYYKRLTKKR